MPQDMRSWIEQVRAAGELRTISKPVDAITQMGALIYQSVGKGLLFNNVAGHPGWRVLAQAPADWHHIGLSLGVPAVGAVDEYSRRVKLGSRPCRLVDDGPVKEVVQRGADVDLDEIPFHIAWEGDAGRYMGSGLCITRDPDTGVRNMGFYRLQIKGKNRTGILWRTETHPWRTYQKYEARGEPMPVAFFNGHHPLVYYPAAWSGSYDVDELELASRLLDEPLALVRCETSDLEVPADAEIIFEGLVHPGVREMEGPYGEFQGYPTGATGPNPVVEIQAVTRRHDAIYKALTNFGREGNNYSIINMASIMLERLRSLAGGPDIRTVHISGDLFTVVIQMSQRYRGDARNVLTAALTGPYLHPKVAIAVDEDVDLYDPAEVMWAISTRVNPADDTFVLSGMRGHPMDISLETLGEPGAANWQAVGSKIGIDATKPGSLSEPQRRERFVRNRPPGWENTNLADFLDP
jgi:2,5-furandicarboxylate decarboxylase 1